MTDPTSAETHTPEVDPTILGKPCVYCDAPCEGHYAIHRDDIGVGPELPLCDAHGSGELPTCEQIWERIAERRARGELE